MRKAPRRTGAATAAEVPPECDPSAIHAPAPPAVNGHAFEIEIEGEEENIIGESGEEGFSIEPSEEDEAEEDAGEDEDAHSDEDDRKS